MPKHLLGILGSQEMAHPGWLDQELDVQLDTPHGLVHATRGYLRDVEALVLLRNNSDRPLASHEINHKANIAALKQLGVTRVIGTAMVGSLQSHIPVGSLLLVDQFIDATRHSQFTFFDRDKFAFTDMTTPFCEDLRMKMIRASQKCGLHITTNSACYVCTDGPRFETKAEVAMFAQLGGDVIGMTNVPECVMAREAGICYATIGGVLNMGAGLSKKALNAHDWLSLRRLHADRFRQIISEIAVMLREDSAETTCVMCSGASTCE